MFGRRAIACIALLVATAVCGALASGAMAVKGTTAYECKPVEGEVGKGFIDAHCTEEALTGKGSYEHVLIPGGATKVSITNHETGEKYVPARMKATIAGVVIELEAEKFTSCAGATVENKVNGSGQMESAGEGCGEFTNVKVLKPATCAAEASIVLKNGLTGKTEVKEEKEVPVFRGTGYRPPGGEEGTFATINISGKSCPKGLLGSWPVNGSVQANMPLEEGRLDGPTLRFTTAQTQKTLKFGGQAASFEGTFTVRAAEGSKNPVSVTTTES